MENLINVEKSGDVVLISLSFNEVSRDQREQLKKDLYCLLGNGERKFILNLSSVGFLSSMVIATIVFFAKEVRDQGGQIKLCCLSAEAMGVLQLTKIDQIFETYECQIEAVESFSAE